MIRLKGSVSLLRTNKGIKELAVNEPIDAWIVNDNGIYVDLEFADGAVAKNVLKDIIELIK